jgi:hypothetical protein
MSFNECLKKGQFYETELLKYLQYDSFITSQDLGRFYDYDIQIKKDDNVVSYEVKSDYKSATTGNLCIEYKCSNNPSGISKTKANYWANFNITNAKNNLYELYIIPVDFIKEMIDTKKYHKDMRGGDYYRSQFYLFKLSLFSQFLIKKN